MSDVFPNLWPEKLSTTKPDLNLFNPFSSCISKLSASLSNKLNAVENSMFSILSCSLPISLIVNLWVFNLSTMTSLGLNVNAGISIFASFIASSKSLGSTGTSSDWPSTILNSPSLVKNNDALLFKKNSKSACMKLSGCGVSTTTAPVPSNCLWKKSNEFPVISSTVDKVDDAPVMSSQVGLKSMVSVKGNSPLGCGSSGSILVAVYVCISS